MGLFDFLSELKAKNNRSWFKANKHRYVAEVEDAMLRFIADIGERLRKISTNFVADPRRIGGSMFRIYRDTQFSKDKSPFKPAAGAQFPHRGRGQGPQRPRLLRAP